MNSFPRHAHSIYVLTNGNSRVQQDSRSHFTRETNHQIIFHVRSFAHYNLPAPSATLKPSVLYPWKSKHSFPCMFMETVQAGCTFARERKVTSSPGSKKHAARSNKRPASKLALARFILSINILKASTMMPMHATIVHAPSAGHSSLERGSLLAISSEISVTRLIRLRSH